VGEVKMVNKDVQSLKMERQKVPVVGYPWGRTPPHLNIDR
jgi:hypothetical protein